MLLIGRGSLERDDEDVYFDDESVKVVISSLRLGDDQERYDVYFDDESAEVVISSLRLGDDQESGSLFTNSNWFSFEEERVAHEQSISAVASPSPNTEGTAEAIEGDDDKVTSNENAKDLVDSATSEVPESKSGTDDTTIEKSMEDLTQSKSVKPPEWRESVEPEPSTEPSIETSVVTSKPAEASQAATDSLPNGNLEANLVTDIGSDALSIKEVDPAPIKKEGEPPYFTTDKSGAVEETGSKTIVGGSPPE
ncbi:serine/threonine-protein phosphatase 6 regulatory subunit 3-like protein [Tanacetum coccineum]